MISLRTIWDERGVLCLYLYQKDPKYVKKWHSCGYLLSERLCDFIEKHMGKKGISWCSFVTKRSKIRQEMAELWQFSPARLRDSIENPMAKMGLLGCSIVTKRSQIGQEIAEL